MKVISNAAAGSIVGLKILPAVSATIGKFTDIKALQKRVFVLTSIDKHFNLNLCSVYKQSRSAAIAQWRQITA